MTWTNQSESFFQHSIVTLIYNYFMTLAPVLNLDWPKEANWRVAEMPRRLKNRHLDLGDVSPADTLRFEHCLTIDPDKVQGIQVNFSAI